VMVYTHTALLTDAQMDTITAKAARERLTPERYLARECERELARVFIQHLEERGINTLYGDTLRA
jgi:hypothetical protein